MVLKDKISIDDLINNGNSCYPDRIKFCIDIKNEIVAIDESMHIDMEYELLDEGSNPENIYGGDIIIDKRPEYSFVWEAHPNLERNRLNGTGVGRRLDDVNIIDKLFDILKQWVI